MKNSYEVRGNGTAIFINTRKLGLIETLIDTDDLNLVSESVPGNWKAIIKKDDYCQVVGRDKDYKTITLHRLLMGFPDGYVVDHINGNPLDNRWSQNLRILTQQENIQHRVRLQSNNKSGIRGVCWYEQTQRWSAQIHVKGKKIHLGYYTDLNEADRVVTEARKKYGFKDSEWRKQG